MMEASFARVRREIFRRALAVHSTTPPESVGRYRILRPLGSGAMGDVFLAEDPNIGRRLAIKTVRHLEGSEAEVRERRRRLLQEARAAGRLLHPNIVTLFDADEEGGLLFLAFEFVEGQDLGHRLAEGLPLSLKQVLGMVREIASALDYAHAQGIVHRDIKPSNILIGAGGEAKVADFGIAKLLDQSTHLTQTGSVIGSPQYMSPEQIRGEKLDGRSDVFSLGVLFYELLTRTRPFDGESISTLVFQILSETPPSVGTLRPDLPPRLVALVDGMMVKDLAGRTASAAQVVREVQTLESDLPTETLVAAALPSGIATQVQRTTAAVPPPLPTDLREAGAQAHGARSPRSVGLWLGLAGLAGLLGLAAFAFVGKGLLGGGGEGGENVADAEAALGPVAPGASSEELEGETEEVEGPAAGRAEPPPAGGVDEAEASPPPAEASDLGGSVPPAGEEAGAGRRPSRADAAQSPPPSRRAPPPASPPRSAVPAGVAATPPPPPPAESLPESAPPERAGDEPGEAGEEVPPEILAFDSTARRAEQHIRSGRYLRFDVEPEDAIIRVWRRSEKRGIVRGRVGEYTAGSKGKSFELPFEGEYLLVLTHDGAGARERAFRISASDGEGSQARVIRASLFDRSPAGVGSGPVLETGRGVFFRGSPADAVVFVDGRRRGLASQWPERRRDKFLSLGPGMHEIRLSAPGYEDATYMVKVRRMGARRGIEYRLKQQ